MPDTNMKDSILRLRELRNELCSNQKDWKEAYQARDFVVEHLQELYEMICNRKIRRKKLEDKSLFILESLASSPDMCNEGEENG